MGFDSGTLAFRLYQLPRALPEDAVARFAAHAAPGLEAVQDKEVAGWVSPRHLLDRHITADSILCAGWIRVTLRLSVRKIPPSLLHAECRMEELAATASQDGRFLNRRQRQEIRQAVTERLLPNMPPQIKAIPMAHNPNHDLLYAGALNDAQGDVFVSHFRQTIGFSPIPLDPAAAAMRLRKVDVEDLPPASFSAQVRDADMPPLAGRDFLTWLWYEIETRQGKVAAPGFPAPALLLEGPLTLIHEGDGAHVTVLRNGEPLSSAEAKTCLLSGKKLKQARLTLAVGDDLWKFTLDADTFVCRAVSLPEDREKLDPVSRFQSRMTRLDELRDMLLALYDRFLAERSDKAVWPGVKQHIREWVKNRTARV